MSWEMLTDLDFWGGIFAFCLLGLRGYNYLRKTGVRREQQKRSNEYDGQYQSKRNGGADNDRR